MILVGGRRRVRRVPQTKAGPVTTYRPDGTVTVTPPLKPMELKALIERSEPRGWRGSYFDDPRPPPGQTDSSSARQPENH